MIQQPYGIAHDLVRQRQAGPPRKRRRDPDKPRRVTWRRIVRALSPVRNAG